MIVTIERNLIGRRRENFQKISKNIEQYIKEIENMKERIEKIATRYGIEVSQVEQGKGGFIIDSSKEKHESVTDIVIDSFNDYKSEN